MTILPRLVNISPQKVMFTPKYVDLRALSSVVASRIYALFVVKSTRVPRLGGGGQASLGNARIFTAFVTATPPKEVSQAVLSRVEPVLKRTRRICEDPEVSAPGCPQLGKD